GVPAEYRDRHALALAGVPPGERRDREHDPRDHAEAVAEPEQPGVEASLAHRHAAEYLGERDAASRSYASTVAENVRDATHGRGARAVAATRQAEGAEYL